MFRGLALVLLWSSCGVAGGAVDVDTGLCFGGRGNDTRNVAGVPEMKGVIVLFREGPLLVV